MKTSDNGLFNDIDSTRFAVQQNFENTLMKYLVKLTETKRLIRKANLCL